MPPRISDDERSVSSEGGVAVRGSSAKATPLANRAKSRSQQPEDEEKIMVDSEDNGEDEDDEEIGEDEYVVESITDHAMDEQGNLFFEVKWEGFEKKSDRTMEPEENLAESASLILSQYLNKIGGREALIEAWEEKKAAAKKGKKRGRAETNGSSGAGAKRGRKEHPASGPRSASARSAEFKPPAGSWEDVVKHIDACEGEEGSVIVYLTWESGHRSQHSLAQVYKRCPQRMLRFYESHLSFKRDKPAGEVVDDDD